MENSFNETIQNIGRSLLTKKDKTKIVMFTEEKIIELKDILITLMIENSISLENNKFRKFIIETLQSTQIEKTSISLILINIYLSQPKYKLNIPFISEIITYFVESAKKIKDPNFSKFVGEIYGKLLKRAPKGIITKFEKNTRTLLNDLVIYKTRNSEERITIYNFLYQLMKNEKYIVFKEIRKSGSLSLFNKVLNEKGKTQDVALIFLEEFVLEVCKQGKDEQKIYFQSLYMDITADMTKRTYISNEYVKGVFYLTKYLFLFLDQTVFQENYNVLVIRIIKVAEDVIFQKENNLFELYMEILPVLAQYKKIIFLEHFLGSIFTKLLNNLNKLKFEDRENMFKSMTDIIKIYNKEQVKEICIKIFDSVKIFLEKNSIKKKIIIGNEIFDCLFIILKKISWIENLNQSSLDAFVNTLLIYSLNQKTVKIINFLCNSNVPNFTKLVKKKLWYTLTIVLRISYNLDSWETMDFSLKNEEEIKDRKTIKTLQQELSYQIENNLLEEIPFRSNLFLNFYSDTNTVKLYIKFKNNIDNFYQKNSSLYNNKETISTALELLAKFGFGSEKKIKRSLFIKNIVLKYLESPCSELRKKAASIVFNFSSEKNPKFKKNLSNSHKIIQGIINKLLIIAVSDPEVSVRKETLTTLNSMSKIFNQYLITEENLKRLILCLYDNDLNIQNQSLLLFQKLVPYNPEILPKIEQLIFKLISFLSLKNKGFGIEDINYILTLRLLVRESPFLIENKLLVICEILYKIALICYQDRYSSTKESDILENMIKAILQCYTNIFFLRKDLSIMFFNQISEFCIKVIENDDHLLIPRAFKCLSILIQSSGFQFILFLKFDIFKIVLKKLEKNLGKKVKYSILKFLGYLGAIQPFYVKKINKMRDELKIGRNITNEELNKLILKFIRKPINLDFFKSKNNLFDDPNIETFKIFKRNVRIINEHSQNIEFEKKNLFEIKNSLDNEENFEKDEKQKKHLKKYHGEFEGAKEVKIYSFESLLNYICEHTLILLFNILNHNNDNEIIGYILDSIELIICHLAKYIFRFKDIIFPKLLLLLNQKKSENLTKMILRQIKIFISASGHQFAKENEFIDQLLKSVSEKIDNPLYRNDILEIFLVLLKYAKCSLRHKLKDIINSLLSILISEISNKNNEKIFKIIYKLDNENYMYHIMPVFMRIINNALKSINPSLKPPLKTVENVFFYFRKTLRCPSIKNYFSNLIRISLELLNGFKNNNPALKIYISLQKNIKDFLIKLLDLLKDKCMLHLPLIHEHLKKEKIYIDILNDLKEKGYFETINTNEYKEQISKDFYDKDKNTFEDNCLRKVNLEQFTQIFEVVNNFKPDDWEDWFNKLKVDLIENSPSNVLIDCKGLICLQDVVRELFKPAFAIVWSQLNDTQKSEILKNLDRIISEPSKAPISVLKEILELVEFMSHDNLNGLNLDVSKLAYLAIKCLSLPKAIYFKEQEFQHSPNKASESLLNLYFESSLVGPTEALLEYGQHVFNIDLNPEWIELMGNVNNGFFEGFIKNKNINSEDPIVGQIKLHSAFSKWEFTIQKIKQIGKWKEDKKKKLDNLIGKYGTQAAFHLGRWDLLEAYNEKNPQLIEKEFYNTCLLIYKKKNREAKKSIKNLRKLFQNESISFSNYKESYQKLLFLQKVTELEEIVKINKRFKEIDENELYMFMRGKEKIKEIKKNMRNNLLSTWEDRLKFMEPTIRYREETISLRSLFCKNKELLPSLLNLAKLCLKKNRHPFYKQIFKNIKENYKDLITTNSTLKLAFCEMQYKTGEKDEQAIIKFVKNLVSDQEVDHILKYKFFKKVGKWLLNCDNPSLDKKEVLDFVIQILHQSILFAKEDYKVFHYFGFANYKAIDEVKDVKNKKLVNFVEKAFHGFVQSISMKSNIFKKFVIQDLLRILDLWFKYGDKKEIQPSLEEAKKLINNEDWLLVVGQIIARLDEPNESIRNSIKNLLINLALNHPQALIFPLLIAKKSKNKIRTRVAQKILLTIKQKFPILLTEAATFADELIRISVLLEEQWYDGINEIRRYANKKNFKNLKRVLDNLHSGINTNKNKNKNKKTVNEKAFFQQFGTSLNKAKELMEMYFKFKNQIFFSRSWSIYEEFYYIIGQRLENLNFIFLENVSQGLLNFQNSKLFVPGTRKKLKNIFIKKIHSVLIVLKSKRKPRKISILGSDNKMYHFLLKGKEDLRQDERVMQFLNLVNNLLRNNINFHYQSLKIVSLYVLPLSVNTGLISWLDNCDTLFQCIKNYREKFGIFVQSERKLSNHFYKNYDQLSKMRKLEIFRYVCENTKAEDLKKILWLRNTSAENWLIYRNNYIRSLAVMSMVGYILGLGDRHLNNIMIQNLTGKVVHIDFGDCFEIAMNREQLPERVPFRLTRVLVNAMEAFGIEGTFKMICENVMNLLRNNKESLIAILEEFVKDPLISWRMMAIGKTIEEEKIVDEEKINNEKKNLKIIESIIDLKVEESSKDHSFIVEGAVEIEMKQKLAQKQKKMKNNEIALEAIKRIKNKLNGKEFDENITKSVKEQVKEIIKQATSHENISQAYSGWNPFI